jgi:hypothetical protein
VHSQHLHAQRIQPELESLILIKCIYHDRAFPARVGNSINIAVIFKHNHPESEKMADEITTAFNKQVKKIFRSKPARAMKRPFTEVSKLQQLLKKENTDYLYVCTGMEPYIPALSQISQSAKILTFSSQRSYLKKGLSLGVFIVGNNPKIFINLPSAKAEGANFGADLLRLFHLIN